MLCPGVRLVAARPAPAARPAKRRRGGENDSDDSDGCGGFGAQIQTLKKDIDHLREIYPGAWRG